MTHRDERYEVNLERALPHVVELMANLSGKTVVIADHDNIVGERAFPLPIREWGTREDSTPRSWCACRGWSTRTATAGDTCRKTAARDEDVDEDMVADRLRNLGYAE